MFSNESLQITNLRSYWGGLAYDRITILDEWCWICAAQQRIWNKNESCYYSKQAPRKYYAYANKLKIHQTLQYPFSWLCVLLKLTPKFNTNWTEHIQFKSNFPPQNTNNLKIVFLLTLKQEKWHWMPTTNRRCEQTFDKKIVFWKVMESLGLYFLSLQIVEKGTHTCFKGRLHVTKSPSYVQNR